MLVVELACRQCIGIAYIAGCGRDKPWEDEVQVLATEEGPRTNLMRESCRRQQEAGSDLQDGRA